MTDIIDLRAERNRREQPDPDCMATDVYGRPVYTFLLGFEMDGVPYGAEIVAYDEGEARRKVEAMRATLAYEGKLFAQVPA